MNIDKINQWLTLLANFGVIGGIIFLGFEIQQNTIAVQAGAIQESTNVARQQLLLYASNPELMRINMKATEDLTEVELRQAAASARSFWIGMQGLHRQWLMGVLPDEEWSMWKKIICANYASARLWPSEAATLVPSFVREVETCSREPDPRVAPVPE